MDGRLPSWDGQSPVKSRIGHRASNPLVLLLVVVMMMVVMIVRVGMGDVLVSVLMRMLRAVLAMGWSRV
jgi:hypothetical protein